MLTHVDTRKLAEAQVLPSLEQPPLFLREINSEAKRGLSGEHKPLKAACRILLLVRCMSQWHKLNDTEGGRVKFYPEEAWAKCTMSHK